jgi:hypothetical protein
MRRLPSRYSTPGIVRSRCFLRVISIPEVAWTVREASDSVARAIRSGAGLPVGVAEAVVAHEHMAHPSSGIAAFPGCPSGIVPLEASMSIASLQKAARPSSPAPVPRWGSGRF